MEVGSKVDKENFGEDAEIIFMGIAKPNKKFLFGHFKMLYVFVVSALLQ
jgi:hypothetical protein